MNIISIYKRNKRALHASAQRLVYNILEWKPNGEYNKIFVEFHFYVQYPFNCAII